MNEWPADKVERWPIARLIPHACGMQGSLSSMSRRRKQPVDPSRQSRAMSMVEALTNVIVGYGLALVTQVVAFPIFGLQVSIADNMVIGMIFTAVSIVRSFTLRRLFEAL